MKKQRRSILITLLCVLLLFVVLPGVLIGRRWRQEQLNLALLEAIRQGQGRQVVTLLEQGADANASPHARLTFSEVVQEMLHLRPRSTSTGPSALLMAADLQRQPSHRNAFAALSDEQAIHALLKHGARANVADSHGETPLMLCAWSGRVREVQALLDHRADIRATDASGMQALEYATWAPDLETVQILVLRGAPINHQDQDGNDALGSAADSNRLDILTFLVLHGADVNSVNTAGTSALMLMVRHGNTAGVKLLLEHGANARAKDRMGRDSLFWLRGKPQSPLRQMLISQDERR